MSLTDALLRPLAAQPARPLITHYDDAAGSRVELSVATLRNWAAKTANWLVDEHDVEPGDPVSVALPAHWQAAGILLGAWWCGAHVVADPAGARVAFVGPDAAAPTAAEDTAAVSLDPMGMGMPGLGDGVLDYLTEARAAGDDFSPLLPIDDATPALCGASVADVLADARARADAAGIAAGSRVLSTREWELPGGALHGLLAPLAAGASLVQVSHPDPGSLQRRRDTERTTVDLAG